MKTKVNFNEIEKNLDFDALSKNLDTLTTTGGLGRRKTVHDLLDKMKPALLRARENRVSLEALTEFLVTSGIPVSEPTLRLYLSAGKSKKKRPSSGRTGPASSSQSVASSPKPAPAILAASLESKKLPPRLAKRDEKASL